MKKIIGLIAVMLGAGVVYAQQQQLTFLTVLPDPVASFDKLEVADTQHPAFAQNVVFGTPNTIGGNIDFVGPVVPDLLKITLRPGTSLVDNNNVQAYGLHTLIMRQFGELHTKRLFATTVAPGPSTKLVIGVTHEHGRPGGFGIRRDKLLKIMSPTTPTTVTVGRAKDFCIRGISSGNCTTPTNVDAYIRTNPGDGVEISPSPSASWQVVEARKAYRDVNNNNAWQWSEDENIDEVGLTVQLLRQN